MVFLSNNDHLDDSNLEEPPGWFHSEHDQNFCGAGTLIIVFFPKNMPVFPLSMFILEMAV